MDVKWKRILPEDVFITIYNRKATEEEMWQGLPCKFDGNRPSGCRFMDIYAHLIWKYKGRKNSFFAKKMEITERELREGIRTLSGIGPVEWRIRYLILVSKELLTTTDWPMTKIAEYIGYSDVSTFSEMFRKHTDKQPWEYRNKRTYRLVDKERKNRI